MSIKERVLDHFNYLENLEKGTKDFYEYLGKNISNNLSLKDFIYNLFSREDDHISMILKAKDSVDTVFKKENNLENIITKKMPVFIIDDCYKNKIKKRQNELKSKVSSDVYDVENLLEYVLEVERLKGIVLNTLNYFDEVIPDSVDFKEYKKNLKDHECYIEDSIKLLVSPNILERLLKKIPQEFKKRILVVDDVEVNRRVLSKILGRQYEVDTAYDGCNALDKLSKSNYDLVISDINMPKMDGEEFFRNYLKKYPDKIDRFVFFSGEIVETQKRLEKYNLIYIKKPIDYKEAKAIVKKKLEK